MARRMTDAQAAYLYALLVPVPLLVVMTAGLLLIVLHVMALHRRIAVGVG